MLPVLALVGRPNVGKSTLFNFLTKTREALVADYPGLTRDRKYGRGKVGEREYLVVDTGGLSGEREGIDTLMAQQTRLAMQEADIILFMVDAREGITANDQRIAKEIRQLGKPILLVVNKTDGLNEDTVTADFYELGLGEPEAIAAAHGRGIVKLIQHVFAMLPEAGEASAAKLRTS